MSVTLSDSKDIQLATAATVECARPASGFGVSLVARLACNDSNRAVFCHPACLAESSRGKFSPNFSFTSSQSAYQERRTCV